MGAAGDTTVAVSLDTGNGLLYAEDYVADPVFEGPDNVFRSGDYIYTVTPTNSVIAELNILPKDFIQAVDPYANWFIDNPHLLPKS